MIGAKLGAFGLCRGHGTGRLLWIPPPAAIEAHVLKDHDTRLQVYCRFGSETALAALAALHIACPLRRHNTLFLGRRLITHCALRPAQDQTRESS
jgi:hypothetical protein